jgi:hypothetical protein|nr:hypothetical protein [Kofleriaceae bacterium]
MMSRLSLLIGLATLASAHVASAGAPAWCKAIQHPANFVDDSSLKDAQTAAAAPDLGTAVQRIVAVSCADKIDPKYDAPLAALRDSFAKRLDMAADDWADAVAFTNENGNAPAFWQPSGTAIETLSPVEQFVDEKADFKNDMDRLALSGDYFYDALGSKLTETGRAAELMWCVKDETSKEEPDHDITKWVSCQIDLDAFDLKKLSSELHADTAHAGLVRFWIRVHAYDLPAQIARVAAQKKQVLAAFPPYKQLFDAVAQGAADWTKTVGTNSKLLDIARQMDDAVWFHSRKALDGCDATTTAALGEAVSTIPAKSFKGMMMDKRKEPDKGFAYRAAPLLVNTPVVHVALAAYVACHPKSAIARDFAWYLVQTPGARGPRTAGLTAAQRVKLQFDDTRKQAPALVGYFMRPYAGYNELSTSRGGTVSSAKLAGDKVTVVPDKQYETQIQCVKEHYSNRIASIVNGNVYYEIVCDQTAPVKEDVTPDTFTVEAQFAKVLTPGVAYSMDGDQIFAVKPKTGDLPTWVLFGNVK